MSLALLKYIFYMISPITFRGIGQVLYSQPFHCKGEKFRLKQISKAEFAWLFKKHFHKFSKRDKCWTKTCVAKGRSKRGKYYVPLYWYNIVKKQNIQST